MLSCVACVGKYHNDASSSPEAAACRRSERRWVVSRQVGSGVHRSARVLLGRVNRCMAACGRIVSVRRVLRLFWAKILAQRTARGRARTTSCRVRH